MTYSMGDRVVAAGYPYGYDDFMRIYGIIIGFDTDDPYPILVENDEDSNAEWFRQEDVHPEEPDEVPL